MTIIALKRIYEPPEASDGHRLLIMRLWPRGIRKSLVDDWDRGLAPSRELLADFRSGAVDWAGYVERFTLEMAMREDSAAALERLHERSARGHVTLLCSCVDEARCHRSLVRDIIEG